MLVKRFATLLVAGGALLTLAAGCDKDVAFFIYQNQVPGSGCVVSTASTLSRAQGLLDLSLGRGYEMFPLLRNELPSHKAAAGAMSNDADPSVLHLREFRVRLDLGDLQQDVDSRLLDFRFAASGTLYPGDLRASRVRVIPDALARTIELAAGARPTVIAEVVARADSADGAVESVPFFFPVELCEGCLVATLDACPTDPPLTNDENVCGLPQDAPLVCCKHPQLGLVCPSAGSKD